MVFLLAHLQAFCKLKIFFNSKFLTSPHSLFSPNPFNCQMYHMCFPSGNNLIAVNILCGGNSAFNPVTSDCSLLTSNPVCQGNPFTCEFVGQMGAWPLNANIYYICMARTTNGIRVLFPQLYRCPVGYYYYNEDCVPNGVTGPGTPPGNGFICSRPGLFPGKLLKGFLARPRHFKFLLLPMKIE